MAERDSMREQVSETSCGLADCETGYEPTCDTSLIRGKKFISDTTAELDEGGVGSGVLERAPSRTMLAHVGAAQES